MGLPLHPYSSPCDFKQPGLSRCCSSLVWQGRDLLTWLSPKSPATDPAVAEPGPHTGPRDLIFWKQSPYRLFFQCPLYFLVSNLHKRWGTVGWSLCSSVDWVGVSPTCRGKRTLLPPILLPSCKIFDSWLFGEEVCRDIQTLTQNCSGLPRETFLKGELRYAGKGSPMHSCPVNNEKGL